MDPVPSAGDREPWFSWPNIVYLAPVPIVSALVVSWEWRALNNRSEAATFVFAVALFVMSYLGIAISLFPLIVPYKYTIWDPVRRWLDAPRDSSRPILVTP